MSTETKKYVTEEKRGTLHVSKIRSKENSPHHFGECQIDGKVYKISGWKNVSQNGNPYLNLKFEDKIMPTDTPETSSTDENPFE